MPPLDMSAALQAAVAAAAEIARVGFSDGGLVLTAASSPAVETGSPPSLEQEAPAPAPIAVPVAPKPEPVVQFQQPPSPVLPEIRPAESTSPSSFSSNQCTGQDAAGDTLQHSHNDMPPLTGGADAAGEKTFEEESEEDAAKRLARSRERNREHARRTRLRKKAQLEALQSRVRDLETEKKALKQKIEECSIASILINLADTNQDEPQSSPDETTSLLDDTIQKQNKNQGATDAKIHLLTAGKRKRFASVDTSEESRAPQALKLQIDGQTRIIGPKSHINWKSGVYSDESGVQRQLTSEQLEGLRRERNRMHAKMTRDRKKNFIATIEKTIDELERDCQKMRDVLNKVGAHQQVVLGAPVAPLPSPRETVLKTKPQVVSIALAPAPIAPVAPTISLLSAAVAMVPAKLANDVTSDESSPKRAKVSHGFSWNG